MLGAKEYKAFNFNLFKSELIIFMANKTKSQGEFVFLDTEVFKKQNFQYDFGLLAAFTHQVKSNRIQFVVTEITVDEIKSNIIKSVDSALSALQSFRAKGRILKNSRSPNLVHFFKEHKRKRIINDLKKQFSSFLEENNAHILPIDDIKPSTIFSRYFSELPPFHDSKKKSEFPDAFALEALNKFTSEKKCNLSIVSGDPDWKKGCETYNFAHFERLDQLLQSLQEETELFKKARKVLDSILPKRISYGIETVHPTEGNEKSDFSELESKMTEEFLLLGFFVADRDAIVSEIKIDSIKIVTSNIVNATSETITFSLDVNVNFEVGLNYFSDRTLPGTIYEISSRRIPFSELGQPASVYEWTRLLYVGSMKWESANKRPGKILDLNIENPRDIYIYVEDYYES